MSSKNYKSVLETEDSEDKNMNEKKQEDYRYLDIKKKNKKKEVRKKKDDRVLSSFFYFNEKLILPDLLFLGHNIYNDFNNTSMFNDNLYYSISLLEKQT